MDREARWIIFTETKPFIHIVQEPRYVHYTHRYFATKPSIRRSIVPPLNAWLMIADFENIFIRGSPSIALSRFTTMRDIDIFPRVAKNGMFTFARLSAEDEFWKIDEHPKDMRRVPRIYHCVTKIQL